MNREKEIQRQEDLKRIKSLRLIDDDFMTICFDNYIEGAELLLKIILDRDDLKVSEVKAQKVLKNLQGRDLRLDIYATDAAGKKYDIEIQRADKGAHRKRARYHSSLIDSDMLKAGEDFADLCENYVIFITENDVLGSGRPIYHIDRVIREDNVQFEVSKRVRQYKETEEGVDTMCDILDEMKNDVRTETRIENARKMLEIGKMTFDEIAICSGLSVEKVRELAGNKSA